MTSYKELDFIDDKAIINFDNGRTLHIYKEQMLGTIGTSKPRFIWNFIEFKGGWGVQSGIKSVVTEEEVTRVLNEVESKEVTND